MPILVFNGRDGEWRAELAEAGKRGAALRIGDKVRQQEGGPDIDYLFAPLKRARLDYMVQKATEMGVARLRPVLTRRTVAERVNIERLARQCHRGGRTVRHPAHPRVACTREAGACHCRLGRRPRTDFLRRGQRARRCPFTALARVAPGPLAVLIGPEGGFEASERELLSSQPFVTRISLGPRILRADTAAVAALALVNAALGDWR